MWNEFRVEDVATSAAWRKDRSMVLSFHNLYRDKVRAAQPNEAHFAIANLESRMRVDVITQNVDDLHERAGSTNVIHLHGQIMRSQSSLDRTLTYPVETSIEIGDKCEKGSQLRPNSVLFGEEPFDLDKAEWTIKNADYLIIVGTSLQVEPAASLIGHAPTDAYIYVIDPRPIDLASKQAEMESHQQRAIERRKPSMHLFSKASVGVQHVCNGLISLIEYR